MNARSWVLSTKLKLFRRILVLAGILDGVLALSLAVAGIWILHLSATGMRSAGAPEDFATGMFVGGIAWVAWLSAASLAASAVTCWSVYRRVGRSGQWRLLDFLTLFLALVFPSVWIATFLIRLVFHG